MTCAIDDIHYASVLERSENPTLQFVSTLINNGVTATVLRKRAIILREGSPGFGRKSSKI